MRDASTGANLAQAEAYMADRLEVSDGREVRVVAGRIFHLDGGVWKDKGHRVGQSIVKVKAFSPAYFRLLQRADELRSVVKELSPVLVAGVDVSFQLGDEGLETLDDKKVEELMVRFRGISGTP